MGHKKVICKVCNTLISQCRCICCDKEIEYSICKDCKPNKER